jgi:hypothetical protein
MFDREVQGTVDSRIGGSRNVWSVGSNLGSVFSILRASICMCSRVLGIVEMN